MKVDGENIDNELKEHDRPLDMGEWLSKSFTGALALIVLPFNLVVGFAFIFNLLFFSGIHVFLHAVFSYASAILDNPALQLFHFIQIAGLLLWIWHRVDRQKIASGARESYGKWLVSTAFTVTTALLMIRLCIPSKSESAANETSSDDMVWMSFEIFCFCYLLYSLALCVGGIPHSRNQTALPNAQAKTR